MDSAALIRYLKTFESNFPSGMAGYLWQCVDQLVLIERQLSHLEIELGRFGSVSLVLASTAAILNSFPVLGWCLPRRCWPRSETSALHLPQGHRALRRLRSAHVRLRRQAAGRTYLEMRVQQPAMGARPGRLERRPSRPAGQTYLAADLAQVRQESRQLWRSREGCCCGLWRAVGTGQPYRSPVVA